MSRITRRTFNRMAAAASALTVLPIGSAGSQVRFSSYPFQLGVASGDPAADGFVIWTRLAPEPFAPEVLGSVVFELTWEVAEDPSFSKMRATGTAFARAHLAHAVHVEVGGLDPGHEYFYRFRIGKYESPMGRALTCPTGAADGPLRFAVASCAHYEQGFFSAYRYIADDKPDLVLMLGDYIYEDAWGERRVRLFDTQEANTLTDYRHRYAQYRTDPDLQAAHAACPWLATWDDHEVDNDYAGLTGESEACGGEAVRESFPGRRAAAYQAYFEHMPLRPSRFLPGMAARLHGTVDWGTLARFYLLDNRQYRSAQACQNAPTPWRCDTVRGKKILFSGAGGGSYVNPDEAACKAELTDPARTMLGAEQERWLDTAFAESPAAWNLLTQGIMFVTIREDWSGSPRIFTDAWAGYPAARERLLASLVRHKTSNPVVLTGDIHSFWVNEIANAAGRPLGVEFVTSSIATTNNDKTAMLPFNPQVRFHEGFHSGYVRCDLNRDKLRADIVAIDDRLDPRSGRRVLATFDVKSGDPHAHRVPGPGV